MSEEIYKCGFPLGPNRSLLLEFIHNFEGEEESYVLSESPRWIDWRFILYTTASMEGLGQGSVQRNPITFEFVFKN